MNDLISREAVYMANEHLKPCSPKDVEDMISCIPSAQQWIPCSERLPIAKHKTYWICTDTGHQCECRWTKFNHFWTNLTTEWHWHIMDIPQYSKVVAWRELPEPYREVDE